MQRLSPKLVVLALVGLMLALSGAAATRASATLESPSAPPASTMPARALTPDERLACQRAIEEVYWQHRLWPAENPTPKPPLDAVLPPDVLQARAEDALRQSNALAARWRHPITGAMLQAEMARMAAETRQPDLLRALWAALDNDPALIAECLARPALAERLLRDWYAQDERLHGAREAEARAALARVGSVGELRGAGGDYQETTWLLGDPTTATREPDTLRLDAAAWEAEQQRLAAWFGAPSAAIPIGQVSALQEDDAGFFAVAVLERREARLRVATLRWPKQPFETWWAAERERFPTPVTAPSFVYRLPEVRGAAAGDPTWLPTPALPSRSNGTAVWTGSEMIIWGGGSLGTGRSSDGARYNPATDAWYTISAINVPMGRFAHSAVWTGSEMIVWGGCGPYEYRICELGDGGRYNPTTGFWTPTSLTNAPSARLYHSAVWTGAAMIIWGGCAPNTNGSSCIEKETGARYDPATDTWSATSLANVPSARFGHTAVWTGAEMVIWGGEDGLNFFNTGGRYNPTTDTWTPTSTANAPSPREGHTAVWTGAEMIVWGGCPAAAGCIIQGTPVNTGGRYDPATDTWVPTSTTNAPSPRTAHTAVWTGTEMIVWGGGTSTNLFFNTGGRYNPASDSWTPTSTTNAPSPRAGHQAVWTGSLMIVWGSAGITGGRYDPATNTWTPTSTEDPNSFRSQHTAVWTGAEMIVWGGEDTLNGTTNSGRIYNPATRTWRATSLVGAPDGRFAHTAVWTGAEMIVWGGQVGNYVYNDGGRYNPASNSWTPTSTTSAPEARSWHTAVWTGAEMIVWGGIGESYYMNTGGRYNPSTNSWAPTSLTNAPPGRYLHTAVWADDEMIVWGGLTATGESNTGGRYDPATNAWSATSTASAPAPRHFHSAIWTGERMIVWGGVADLNNPTNFSSGGQYDPDTNAWTPTSLTGAPQGRVRHTAVWTGAEMIVWGGCVGLYCGDPLYTGGHYDPLADSWQATALDGGTPRARGEHTAVWTGDRMIVWGGLTDASTYTNTGAEYFTDAPGNQPPVAFDDSYSTPANTLLSVAAPGVLGNDSDADGNTLTALLASDAAHGTLGLAGDGSFTYTPDAGYSGSDSFTYRVWDGLAYSNEAGVTITVTGAGATPTPTATSTAVPPTSTATPTATAAPPTPTPTSTSVPPTATPTSTAPPPGTATPTATAAPPTPTATSTVTSPTVTATITSVPPTVTPTMIPDEDHRLHLPLVRR